MKTHTFYSYPEMVIESIKYGIKVIFFICRAAVYISKGTNVIFVEIIQLILRVFTT
jgi:hypothetical protein